MKSILTLLLTVSLSAVAYSQTVAPYQDPSLEPEQRALDLLGRLTLEQKVALMSYNSPEIPELGIRKYNWWNEALHGSARNGLATVFPQAIGMAASWDDALLQQVYDVASTEQRIKFNMARREGGATQYRGLTVWTPNINIFRDPRWGRGQETYGEDPFLTTSMGRAAVNGLQGDTGLKYDKLHACLKHFAIHSFRHGNCGANLTVGGKFTVSAFFLRFGDSHSSRILFPSFLKTTPPGIYTKGIQHLAALQFSIPGQGIAVYSCVTTHKGSMFFSFRTSAFCNFYL